MKHKLLDAFSTAKFRVLMAFMMVFMMVGTSFAQVALVIDTDPIFTSANSWIVTFTPIIAIGVGIGIAIAILTFVGDKIVNSFKGR